MEAKKTHDKKVLSDKYKFVSPYPDSLKTDIKIGNVLDQITNIIQKALKRCFLFKNSIKAHHISEIKELIGKIRVLIEQRQN